MIKIIEKRLAKVLVLGSDNRSFLSVIRSLGRRDIDVHVGWCPEGCSALRSGYIKKILKLPEYSYQNDNWKKDLIKILKKENYDLVIPCNDRSIIPLQLNKSELLKYAKIYLLGDSAYEIVSNKIKTSQLAKRLGINLPRQKVVSKANINIADILKEFNFPIVLKPVSAYIDENLKNKRFIKKAYNKGELIEYLNNLNKDDEIIIQENFIGQGIGIEVLAKDGKILYAFQHRRIHEPLTGGGSIYRKSEKINPELLDAALKLIKELNYTGVAMIEFKYNFESRKWVFLEINGRFWGSLPLAVAAGADFPYYLYELLIENKEKFNPGYKTNIYCRNLINDIYWIYYNFKADKSDPTLHTLSNLEVISEIKNIIFLRERSDVFVMDDLRPGFYELFQVMFRLINFIKVRMKIMLLSFPIVRNYKKKKMIKLIKKSKYILFVCKGNICRSPFAEYAAKSLWPKSMHISSCGYIDREGRTSPPEAIKTAEELGVNISNRKSRIVRERDVYDSDIIIIFDRENYSKLIKKHPGAKSKIFYLGILGSGKIDIDDPQGQGINKYKVVYRKIYDLVKYLSKEL